MTTARSFYDDRARAEIRVIGVGRLGFAMQAAPDWRWMVLREVETREQVAKLCEALGYQMMER